MVSYSLIYLICTIACYSLDIVFSLDDYGLPYMDAEAPIPTIDSSIYPICANATWIGGMELNSL